MLRRKIPIFEVILGIYFLLQTVLPAQFSRSSSLVGFILFSFTKYHYEGFRIAYIIFLLIQLVLLIYKSIYLAIPIAILMSFTIYYFPIYKYPTPTGKYRVGYRMIKVQGPKEATTVGVYYPTNQKSGDVKYSPSHKSWERFADIMRLYADSQKKFLIPKIVFKIVLSFLEHQYLGVNKNVPIAKIEGNKKGYPVVLFSHGHSANIHIYSIMLKEWASHGFVIFSVDHEEEIHMDIAGFKGFQDYLAVRNKQLSVRKELLKSILDKICDSKFVQDLFEDSSVTLNYEKLVVSGHSFGALAAPELAVEDRRITGGMVLLDPWFECANFDVSFKEVNLPLLSIRSDEYDKQTEVKTKIMQHVEKSNKDKEEVISGIVEKASHNAVTDLSVMMPREMAVLGDVSSFKRVEDHLRTYFTLTRTFLKSVVEYKKNEKSSLKTVVMEKYKKELEEMGKKDIFIME